MHYFSLKMSDGAKVAIGSVSNGTLHVFETVSHSSFDLSEGCFVPCYVPSMCASAEESLTST